MEPKHISPQTKRRESNAYYGDDEQGRRADRRYI